VVTGNVHLIIVYAHHVRRVIKTPQIQGAPKKYPQRNVGTNRYHINFLYAKYISVVMLSFVVIFTK